MKKVVLMLISMGMAAHLNSHSSTNPGLQQAILNKQYEGWSTVAPTGGIPGIPSSTNNFLEGLLGGTQAK